MKIYSKRRKYTFIFEYYLIKVKEKDIDFSFYNQLSFEQSKTNGEKQLLFDHYSVYTQNKSKMIMAS